MPKGKGTYGSMVGRPPKKKKEIKSNGKGKQTNRSGTICTCKS
jgi:hypothetical protein